VNLKVIAVVEKKGESGSPSKILSMVLKSIDLLPKIFYGLSLDSIRGMHASQLTHKVIGHLSKLSEERAGKISGSLLNNLLSKDDWRALKSYALIQSVTEAVHRINELKKMDIPRMELVREIVKATSQIGIKQVIGWQLIDAGPGKSLPQEVADNYRYLMQREGRKASDIEKQLSEHNKTVGDWMKPNRKMLAMSDYASAMNEMGSAKIWKGIIARNLQIGLNEISDSSVLNMSIINGNGFHILDVDNTVSAEVHSAKMIEILKLAGLNSYCIVPMRTDLSRGDIMSEVDDEQVSMMKAEIDRFKTLIGTESINIDEDISGAFHLLINRKEELDPEIVKLKIEAAQMFINMAAQVLRDVKDEDFLKNTQKMLQDYTEKVVGKEVAAQAFQRIQANQSTFNTDVILEEKTVLFSDIQGFTPLIEGFEAAGFGKMFIKFINEYWAGVVDILFSFNDVCIHKFQGDGIMVSFPADSPDGIKAGIMMQNMLAKLNPQLQKKFKKEIDEIKITQLDFDPSIHIRIGLDTGKVALGTVGAVERFEEGAMGMVATTASRNESIGSYYGYNGIIIGHGTYLSLKESGEAIVVTKLMEVKHIGKKIHEPIYVVEGLAQDLSPDQLKIAAYRGQATDLLLNGKSRKAHDLYEKILRINPQDSLAIFFKDKLDLINKTRILVKNSLNYLNSGYYHDSYNVISRLQRMDSHSEFAAAFLKLVENEKIEENMTSQINIKLVERLRDLYIAFENKDKEEFDLIIEKFSQNPRAEELMTILKNAYESRSSLDRVLNINRFFYPTEK